MKSWNLWFVLLYCYGAFCAPTTEEPTSTTVKNTDNNGSLETSEEVSVPHNMNIADYYYSIFGKHLDYDYREPLLTFDEPSQNALSDEVLSEVDKGNVEPWDTHSRKKRFILAPAAFYNASRTWYQQRRRLRAERRRLRQERTRQWQSNRIRYLHSRAEYLERQANRLTELQQKQLQQQAATAARQTVVRNVPEKETQRIMLRVTTTTTTTSKPSSPASANSDSVPVP